MLHSLICNKTTGVLSVQLVFVYVQLSFHSFVVLSHIFQKLIGSISRLPIQFCNIIF